jgi:dihydroflavonol-4-reductase
LGRRVFVTGGSGFIGLIRRLLEYGYEVAALWRHGSAHPLLEGLDFERLPGDIVDHGSLLEAMKGSHYVFHSAAKITFNRYEYDELYRVNVEGTENVLKAALETGVKRFVHLSACAVLGYSRDKNGIIDEDSTPVIPKGSVYAYTKKLAEDKVIEASSRGLGAVIINPSTVYGEGDLTFNSGLLIKSVYTGKMRVAPPGGTSVVAVDDVVEGLILAMDKGEKGRRYILSNERMSYLELCNFIADALKVKSVKYSVPTFLYAPVIGSVYLLEYALNLLNRPHPLLTVQVAKETFAYKYYSSRKAREELGWRPKTSIEEAARKAFEFYRKEGKI